MKIKHWAGYGCVTARKISKKTRPDGLTELIIYVEGNHERGLERSDLYDMKRWLVDRFDKAAGDINPYRMDMAIDSGYKKMAGGAVSMEYAVYTFTY